MGLIIKKRYGELVRSAFDVDFLAFFFLLAHRHQPIQQAPIRRSSKYDLGRRRSEPVRGPAPGLLAQKLSSKCFLVDTE